MPPDRTIETQTVVVTCDCGPPKPACAVDRPLAAFQKSPEKTGQRLRVIWKASANHEAGEFRIVYSGGASQEKNLVFPADPPPPISFRVDEDAGVVEEGVGFVSHRWWKTAGGPGAVDLRWDYKVEFDADDLTTCEVDPQICVPGLDMGGPGGGTPCR